MIWIMLGLTINNLLILYCDWKLRKELNQLIVFIREYEESCRKDKTAVRDMYWNLIREQFDPVKILQQENNKLSTEIRGILKRKGDIAATPNAIPPGPEWTPDNP